MHKQVGAITEDILLDTLLPSYNTEILCRLSDACKPKAEGE